MEVTGGKFSEIAGDKLLEDVEGALARASEASRALRLGARVGEMSKYVMYVQTSLNSGVGS